MRKIAVVGVVLALVLSLTACGTSNSDTKSSGAESGGKQAKEKYVVGIDTTYPPFEFEENGTYKGIDVDLIHAIAEEEGFEVELKAMDFKGIIPALLVDQLDIAMGGMSITEDRKKKIDFSDPYYESGVTLVVAEDTNDIEKPEDLKGKLIAVKKGTTGADMGNKIAEQYGAKTRTFNDSPSMFQEVRNGNADALIEDYPVIAYAIEKKPNGLKIVGDRLNGDPYGIGVKKGNDELLKKINDGLQKLKDNGKYDEIISKYLGENQ